MKKLFLIFLAAFPLFSESPFRGEYEISSPYLSTVGYGGERRNNVHRGCDLYPIDGDWVIFPVMGGIVSEIGICSVYGKYVIVDHQNGLFSLYAHGQKIYYSGTPGRKVDNTVPLMKMGSTGYSDNPHLHIEVFRIVNGEKIHEDPEKYFGNPPEFQGEKNNI